MSLDASSLAAFEPHRPRLLRVAYRMLGTLSDAEDLVQDAYLRWHETDRDAVAAPEGLLVKTVVRLAIDRLRRLKRERAHYHGQWLPEPWLGDAGAARGDELGYAASVLLERLGPDERAAFLMREVFDLDYAQVAEILEKTEAASRKLVQRAKEHLADPASAPARAPVTSEAKQLLLEQLVAASRAESAEALERMLTEAAHMISDGGGKVFAARYPLEGAHHIADTLWRIKRKNGPRMVERVVDLDGEPAIVAWVDGVLFGVTYAEVRGGVVTGLYMVVNPDKLIRVAARFPAPARA
ncbi:MAG: sigma-70 family RNA polymerase sigma factor [Polyangiales bacterium]